MRMKGEKVRVEGEDEGGGRRWGWREKMRVEGEDEGGGR